MGLANTRTQATFVSIGSNGDLRVNANESTPGAVKRDYELSNGSKGSKWELIYNEMTGIITSIQFRDGDYGEQMLINFWDDGVSYVLTTPASSNFATDIMKKIPNINVTKPITIKPYSLTDDKGKPKKGVTIIQDGSKITNFFVEEGEDGKKKEAHGFPVKEAGKAYKTSDWKLYFMQVAKFLQEYTEANVTPALLSVIELDDIKSLKEADEKKEEISVDATPFD